MLILSLFPGLGLLDMAFEEAGFCVVRGPDKIWGGDIKDFHAPPGKFTAVIGGPPCQPFSQLRHMVAQKHRRHPEKYHQQENLIPEFVRIITEAAPLWFLMENVPGAPSPLPPGYSVISFVCNNRWVPDTTPQNRVRRFWFGHWQLAIDLRRYLDFAVFEPAVFEYAVTSSARSIQIRRDRGGKPKRVADNRCATQRTIEDSLKLQGLPSTFFDEMPRIYTNKGKHQLVGNGVPLPLGRAVVKAIIRALEDNPC